MESVNGYLIAIPTRGVAVADQIPFPGIASRHWMLTSPRQITELASTHIDPSNLVGNLELIVGRIAPDALLFVRYFPGQRDSVWNEDYGERILSALNMVFLLSPHTMPSADAPYPRILFRARYREFCDLPLSFNEERVLASGHTSRVGLLASDRAGRFPQVLPSEVDSLVEGSPHVIQKILQAKALTQREDRLASAMEVVHSSFLGLSQGAIVSSLVSAAEVLLDSQSQTSEAGDRSWARRLARMKTIAGPGTGEVIDRLLDARNTFVHSAKQPPNDLYAFAALALAVQAWGVVSDLANSLNNMQDVEAYIDAVADANRISAKNLDLAEGLLSKMPGGPRRRLSWVEHHLTKLPLRTVS